MTESKNVSFSLLEQQYYVKWSINIHNKNGLKKYWQIKEINQTTAAADRIESGNRAEREKKRLSDYS